MTGAADSFNPNANDNVLSIAVQSDGKVLAGGFSITIGGQSRNRIARLDAGLATDSFNPNAGNAVYAIAIQADGKILVGGLFSAIGGQVRSRIARLDPATGLVDSFSANANSGIFTIAMQSNGKIMIGGAFMTKSADSRAVGSPVSTRRSERLIRLTRT